MGKPFDTRTRHLAAITLSLIVVLGVIVRTFVASRGWFYWDDLILHSRAREYDVPGPGLLFKEHDGHLMPGAWLIEWLLASFAPLNWPAAVTMLGILQLLAAGAVARACFLLCPNVRWASLPLVLYLVAPLTLPTTTWLATAVNILPLHAALALMLAYSWRALQRDRAGARRDLTIAGGALLGGLFFTERALFAGPAVVFTLVCFAAATGVLRRSLRGIARIAVVLSVPTLGWLILYSLTVGDPRADGESMVADLLSAGYLRGLLPTVAGGPWSWERWHPSPPWADPHIAALVAGALAIAMVLLWTSVGGIRRVFAWLPTLKYPLIPLLSLAFARTGPDTSPEITQTLRHFSEVAVLAVLTVAFLLGTRHQQSRFSFSTRPWLTWVGSLAVVCFIVSSAVSTVAYTRVWADQPARDYFTTLRSELDGRTAPLLDQAVSFDVLLPVAYPDNQLSRLLNGVDGVPPIGRWTTDPVLIDADGHLRTASLVSSRATGPGDEPGCGTRVDGAGTSLSLDGPLIQRDWVLQFNYFADHPGTLRLALDADSVEIPLEASLAQVHVRLDGGGSELRLILGEGLNALCVGQSHIGVLAVNEPADP